MSELASSSTSRVETCLIYLKAQWDRSIAVGCLVVAAIAMLNGYLGISDTPHVADQLPYFISAGAFGVALCAVAGMLWVSADLRDEWREIRSLRAELAASEAAAIARAGGQ
jgi:hypothetical protein